MRLELERGEVAPRECRTVAQVGLSALAGVQGGLDVDLLPIQTSEFVPCLHHLHGYLAVFITFLLKLPDLVGSAPDCRLQSISVHCRAHYRHGSKGAVLIT